MVGLPDTPVALVMLIWPDVPVSERGVTVEPSSTTKPVPDMPASEAAKPLSAIVGFPATPSPFVTAKPSPETATERFVTVFDAVLTTMPFKALSRLPDAPLRVMR